MHTLGFDGIGTHWEIGTATEISPRVRLALEDKVIEFDMAFSRFRRDSIVAGMASAPQGGVFRFPDGASEIFDVFDVLHDATEGAVDPLVGRDLELLGYDREYSLKPDAAGLREHSRHRPRWGVDVVRYGTVLQTGRPLVLDIGAVGKGYLVDVISKMLVDHGHAAFIVDGSGDMRHRGGDPVIVGLEHPGDPEIVIGTFRLSDRSICASATNRRSWGNGLHHVVDARTGRVACDVLATWAIADDAAIADGIATALFFGPAERMAEEYDFEFVRMFSDGSVERSAGFDGEIFN